MSERAPHTSTRHCPKCDAAVRPDAQTGQAPSFCLHCRFPVMLVAGKYRLVRVLGEGGFATVYEARADVGGDARYVAKVLKPEFLEEPGMKARFDREVQVTSTLSRNSQHIVYIYDDFGEIAQLGSFYVMEYLDGLSLSQIIENSPDGLLPLERVYQLFGQLCLAMDVAHQGDVVHRDLKPDNLFIIKNKEDGDWLKVIDFGIAKPLGTEKAVTKLTHGVLGTPAYMAPELYMSQPVGHYTDIYAMGIILYELLAGHTPFAPPHLPSPSAAGLMASHVMEVPPSLTSALPAERSVPVAMDDVIAKSLAKRPEDRFATVHDFLEAFRAAIEGRPLPEGVSSLQTEDFERKNNAIAKTDETAPPAEGSFTELMAALSPGDAFGEATVVQRHPAPSLQKGPELEEIHGDVLVVHDDSTAVTPFPVAPLGERGHSPMTIEELPALHHISDSVEIDISLRADMAAHTNGAMLEEGVGTIEHVGAIRSSSTSRQGNNSGQRTKIAILSACGLLLFGLAWLLWPSSDGADPVSAAPVAERRTEPVPWPRPAAITPQPDIAPMPFRLSVQPRRRRAVPSRRPRKRSRRRRRRSRRYAPYCPRRSRLRWIYLTFSGQPRSRVKVRFRGGRGRTRRRAKGLCVGVYSRNTRVILSLSRRGQKYDSCSFTFSRYAPRARVRFQKRVGDLVGLSPDKCLRKR